MKYDDEILKALTYATFEPAATRIQNLMNKFNPMWGISHLGFSECKLESYSCVVSVWVKHSESWTYFLVSRDGCNIAKYINGEKLIGVLSCST